MNKYVGGEDEVALDKRRKMVASIAYGPCVRTFRIREKKSKEMILDIEYQPCSLLVMEGEFQKDFTYEIPVQKKRNGERISVTFRHHLE